ncbi:hypothetical protein PJI17_32580, partial [Mycobacterium kansasii]
MHDFKSLVHKLSTKGIKLDEVFLSGALIEKLPPSWKEYKNRMKHKKSGVSLETI